MSATWRGGAEIHEFSARSRAWFAARGLALVGEREALDIYLWSP